MESLLKPSIIKNVYKKLYNTLGSRLLLSIERGLSLTKIRKGLLEIALVFEYTMICLIVWIASPSLASVVIGLVISLLGELLIIWERGYTYDRYHHGRDEGPYPFVQHPLEMGYFLIILGVCILSRHAWIAVTFILGSLILNYLRLRHLRPQRSILRKRPDIQYHVLTPFIIPTIIGYHHQKSPREFSLRYALFRDRNREIFRLLAVGSGYGFFCAQQLLPMPQISQPLFAGILSITLLVGILRRLHHLHAVPE